MYAVIFRAKIIKQTDEYSRLASKLRQLALDKYRCIDFVAVTQEEQEIAISYWHDEGDILAWRKDSDHLMAQLLGAREWYSSYQVDVTEVKRSYLKN